MATDTMPESGDAVPTATASYNVAEETETAGFTEQSVGGVFDTAFDLYKRNFATLALIVACVFVPTQVILHAAGNLWLRPLTAQFNSSNPDFYSTVQIFLLGTLIGDPQSGLPGYVSLLTSFMAGGPVAVAVANILVGRPLTVGTAYRRAVPVFWRLFWTWNLLFLVFFLVSLITVIVLAIALTLVLMAVAGSGMSPNTAGIGQITIGFLILMVLAPYVIGCALATALFAFAPPLIALENLTVLEAVERNSRLVSRPLFWRTFHGVTLLPLVIFGLQYLILMSASSVVPALKWPNWSGFVVNTGLSSLINFFFQPYWMIFITLLYFDCRVRREGIDVRYMADNLSELDPLLTPSDAVAPPTAQTGPEPPDSQAMPGSESVFMLLSVPPGDTRGLI